MLVVTIKLFKCLLTVSSANCVQYKVLVLIAVCMGYPIQFSPLASNFLEIFSFFYFFLSFSPSFVFFRPWGAAPGRQAGLFADFLAIQHSFFIFYIDFFIYFFIFYFICI